MTKTEYSRIMKRLKTLASAILEQQRYGQLNPDTIEDVAFISKMEEE